MTRETHPATVDAEVERLRTALAEANHRANLLHKRAQAAEAQVLTTIEDCRRQGVSIGRGLANAGYLALAAERDELCARIAAVRVLCEPWAGVTHPAGCRCFRSPCLAARVLTILDGPT